MRRLMLAVVPLGVGLAGWFASVSAGQSPSQDSVVGYVEFFAGSNNPPGRIGFDVHSGPSGESPGGSISGLPVGCLHVSGNTAVVGVDVGDQGAFFFSLVDASMDKWTTSREPGPVGPDDCKTRFSSPIGGVGDFVITDAVADTSPPILTVPSGIAVNASGLSGARVTYSISATDNLDTSPDVTCNPPSGSTFPVGTTIVTCTATDDSGNKTTKSFNVVVRLPTSKQECKNGGWRNFGSVFKNQGDCVSFVATGGKKPPAG
ncbi:MAG: HYR domain-containing protein [Thermoleophilaceae bacterium]|nr:HYR domain-containing protein [Thermoleophilaceae bacterium]